MRADRGQHRLFDAYTEGLAAASPNAAYWIAYTGTVTATAAMPETDLVEGFMGANNANGRLFAFPRFSSAAARVPRGNHVWQSVVAFDHGQIRWRAGIVGHCAEPVDIDALPDGGAIVTVIDYRRLSSRPADFVGTAR